MKRDPTRNAHVWVPRHTSLERPADTEHCRAAVHDGGRWPSFHQCRRKPIVHRELDSPAGTYGFCKQHDPVQVDLRRRAQEHAWSERSRKQQEGWQRTKDTAAAKERCVAALREIEAGHNDPRALAREALHQLDVLK